MKLDHDCVRAVLLYLEKTLELDNEIDATDIVIKKYQQQDIVYSVRKLAEAGYLNTTDYSADDEQNIIINSISWDGHRFLDTVRDPKVWMHSKSVASKLLSVSIGMMENIASQVITNLVSQQLGLNPLP